MIARANSNVICAMQIISVTRAVTSISVQTFRYWQAFLGKTWMNLNANVKVLKKCRGKRECLIFVCLSSETKDLH